MRVKLRTHYNRQQNKMITPAFEFIHLSTRYPGTLNNAVEDLNFEIQPGTINVLIGPNGAGKSTVLKAILGSVAYTGRILAFGQPVEKSHSLMGYVPQRYQFDQTIPITVQEFLSLAFLRTTLTAEQQLQRIKKILSELGALPLRQRLLNSLSGGELQRVLLSRALLHQPKILLLDEPETGIDIAGGAHFYQQIFEKVKKEKLTVLIASHELEIVSSYADNVICINHQLLCTGKPQTILQTKNLEKVFGMGLSVYTHHPHLSHSGTGQDDHKRHKHL